MELKERKIMQKEYRKNPKTWSIIKRKAWVRKYTQKRFKCFHPNKFCWLEANFYFLQRVTEWYARSSIFSKVNCWHIIMPLINGIKFENRLLKSSKVDRNDERYKVFGIVSILLWIHCIGNKKIRKIKPFGWRIF